MAEVRTIDVSRADLGFTSDSIDGVYITRSPNHFFLMRVSHKRRKNGMKIYNVSVSPTPHNFSEPMPDVDVSTCLEISIRVLHDNVKSHIEYLSYEKTCAMCKPLERKTGTYEMMMSTLSFCSALFQSNRFSLKDKSKFFCTPIEEKIIMQSHNLLIYGKSWYERMFNAKPKKREDRILWSNIQSRIHEVVDDDIMVDVVDSMQRSTKREKWGQFLEIMTRHNGTSSWNRMFQEINELEEGCIFFQTRIMYKIGHEDVLDIPDIIDWVIEIDETMNDEHLLAYKKIY